MVRNFRRLKGNSLWASLLVREKIKGKARIAYVAVWAFRFLLDGGKLGGRGDELGREGFYAAKAFCSEYPSYLEYVLVAQAILPF